MGDYLKTSNGFAGAFALLINRGQTVMSTSESAWADWLGVSAAGAPPRDVRQPPHFPLQQPRVDNPGIKDS